MNSGRACTIGIGMLLITACRPGTATPVPGPTRTLTTVPVPIPRKATSAPAPLPPQGATPSATPGPAATPARGSTITVKGSVKITGDVGPCGNFLPGNCSGKSEFYNLPAPDDFMVVLNGDRQALSGRAEFKVHSKWHYTTTYEDCPAKNDSDGSIAFVGTQHQSEGGQVKVIGKTTWDQRWTAEINCPRAVEPPPPGDFSEALEDSLELQGLGAAFDLAKAVGREGKCKLGFLDTEEWRAIFPRYDCAWRIEEVK